MAKCQKNDIGNISGARDLVIHASDFPVNELLWNVYDLWNQVASSEASAAEVTGQMAEWYRASASGSVDFGFDSESGQTNDFKIGIHSFPA